MTFADRPTPQLVLTILALLSERPGRLDDIWREMLPRTSGCITTDVATVRDVLQWLERSGLVRSTGGAARSSYLITPAGAEYIIQNQAGLDYLISRAAFFGDLNACGEDRYKFH